MRLVGTANEGRARTSLSRSRSANEPCAMSRPGARLPSLGFVDVMLAGLARDGGLYVPEFVAAARRPGDRRLRRPALRGGRGRGHPSLCRRRSSRARPRPHGARGLRQFSSSGGRPSDAIRTGRFRARTVSRADARLQGSGHAASRPADGPCAGRARRAYHRRGRDLGRHRRRRGRGVPRPRARRSLRACFRKAASPTCSGG